MSQEQKYGGIWTKKGLEKLASFVSGGNPINITESAFGDGNGTIPTPEAENTSLVNEVWRGKVASVAQKEGENSQSVIVEVVIPYNVGGFFIREWGLYDADGDLVVYGNHAEFYKALLIEGTGAELRELIELPISSKGQVQITVNYESLASVDYVNKTLEEKLNEHDENENAHENIVTNFQEKLIQLQENVVNISSKQIITGYKSFLNIIRVFRNDFEIGQPVAPSEKFSTSVGFADKNGNLRGGVANNVYPDKQLRTYIACNNYQGDRSEFIIVGWDNEKNCFFTYVPSPTNDNSNQIATTSWVQQNKAKTLIATRNTRGVFTFTGLKPGIPAYICDKVSKKVEQIIIPTTNTHSITLENNRALEVYQ